MYVIYPADELLRIYENPNRDWSSVLTGERRRSSCQIAVIAVNDRTDRVEEEERKKRRERRGDRDQTRRKRTTRRNGTRSHEVARGTSPENNARTMLNSRGAGEDAANPFKDLTQPGLNEPLKQHNASALKLVQTGEWLLLFSFELYSGSG